MRVCPNIGGERRRNSNYESLQLSISLHISLIFWCPLPKRMYEPNKFCATRLVVLVVACQLKYTNFLAANIFGEFYE